MTDTPDRPNVDPSHYAENAGHPVPANPVTQAALIAEAEAHLAELRAQPVAPVEEEAPEPAPPAAATVDPAHVAAVDENPGAEVATPPEADVPAIA